MLDELLLHKDGFHHVRCVFNWVAHITIAMIHTLTVLS